jgi:hypothetical protein
MPAAIPGWRWRRIRRAARPQRFATEGTDTRNLPGTVSERLVPWAMFRRLYRQAESFGRTSTGALFRWNRKRGAGRDPARFGGQCLDCRLYAFERFPAGSSNRNPGRAALQQLRCEVQRRSRRCPAVYRCGGRHGRRVRPGQLRRSLRCRLHEFTGAAGGECDSSKPVAGQ